MASEKIVKFVEEIKTLTVLELADLVKAIEEEFGVSAAAPLWLLDRLPALLPLQRKKRNSTLFWLRLALPKWALSNW